MITINRERRVPYTIATMYAVLAEPQNLPRVLPRITTVEPGEGDLSNLPLTVTFNFGSQLGHRTAPGVFRAADGREVSFECSRPIPIVARWTLVPADDETLIKAALSFDLKPLLGVLTPLAPLAIIKRRVTDELDEALRRAETLAGAQVTRVSAVNKPTGGGSGGSW